jgi:cytochrome bd ubiquinol oxidase subunit II
MTVDLPLICAGIIGFAVFMYVLMDGFDLGIGVLFPLAPSHGDRDIMMNTIAPVWDGNETWLVLGGSLLLAAYPLAYSVILSALYLPLIVMLVALIFRGVAFEFRFNAQDSRYLWDIAFNVGSTVAAFAQGVVLGAFVQGFEVRDGGYAGPALGWLTPFSMLTGLALVAGYTLLGAAWIVLKTEGPLRDWAYRMTGMLVIVVLGFTGAVSLWVPFLDTHIAQRWFSFPNILMLWPVPAAVLATTWATLRAVKLRQDNVPFPCAIVLFMLGYLGLVISLFPNILPPAISIWDAASPPSTQGFLVVGLVVVLPAILAYTAYSYWVFRGKVTAAIHYHH